MSSAQLDLAELLAHGAARLAEEAPATTTSPAVVSRLHRVLGARLPCQAVIHWVCPVCRARAVTRWRCGPRCERCNARVPASESLLRQLPSLPIRHWVLSLPAPQRFELAGDPPGEAAVVKAFVKAIFAALRDRDGDASAGCGAVVAVHRTGSALDLNLHVHALVVDGVFHRAADGSRFVEQSLAGDELTAVACAVHRALAEVPAASTKDRDLAALQRAARPRRTLRKAATSPQRQCGLVGAEAGVRVFTGEIVRADDRARLRRLCDYLTRPAAARLTGVSGSADALRLPLPPQPDGATHAALSSRDVVARLVAATPPGPAVSVRTYGVLAPRAASRWQVTRGRQLALPGLSCDRPPPPPRADPPRCRACDVDLEAVAIDDAADPPPAALSSAGDT